MNAVTTTDTPRQSLIATMAARYNMEPATFAATLRATVVPKSASNEEFAAFLMVAKEYGLNPITKEIYAFPKQGGGIQPIVSVDGWANLINSHPQCDGIEFEDHMNADGGGIICITCRIYRKDRSHPTTATEYMVECTRPTPVWKQWPRRMLRHKALIQAARYAFGFAGIVDPDEAARFTTAPQSEIKLTVEGGGGPGKSNAFDSTPARPQPLRPPAPPPITSFTAPGGSGPLSPAPPPANVETITVIDAETGEITEGVQEIEQMVEPSADVFFENLENDMASAIDAQTVEEVWNHHDPMATFEGQDVNQGIAMAIKNRRLKQLRTKNG